MPFDFSPDQPPVTVPDAPRERLAMLETMLRGDMPVGFRWNYGDVLGLTDHGTTGCAARLWEIGTKRTIWFVDEAVKEFGLSPKTAVFIFHNVPDGNFAAVTPAIVADRIAKVLAEVA